MLGFKCFLVPLTKSSFKALAHSIWLRVPSFAARGRTGGHVVADHAWSPGAGGGGVHQKALGFRGLGFRVWGLNRSMYTQTHMYIYICVCISLPLYVYIYIACIYLSIICVFIICLGIGVSICSGFWGLIFLRVYN